MEKLLLKKLISNLNRRKLTKRTIARIKLIPQHQNKKRNQKKKRNQLNNHKHRQRPSKHKNKYNKPTRNYITDQ